MKLIVNTKTKFIRETKYLATKFALLLEFKWMPKSE